MAALRTVQSLLKESGLSGSLTSCLHLVESARPVVPSSFGIGHLAQATIAASALAATNLLKVRGGSLQDVTVDERHAVLEFCELLYEAFSAHRNWLAQRRFPTRLQVSEAWTITDGLPAPSSWDPLAGAYQTSDGYVRIHTNFPHHRQGIISLLNSEESREGIASALQKWRSEDFEDAAANAELCVTALRSFEQWDAHPQGLALEDTPPLQIIKVAEGPPRVDEYIKSADGLSRPLAGIRVLDLTRVIAGPVCGRTLAAHGADVLNITSAKLPNLPDLEVDTCRGKRTTQLDLTTPEGKQTLENLVRDADVFLQGYRPGALKKKGFGVDDVVRMRPGMVYASLNAYGWNGPWENRRGFDSLTQTATGINIAEAEAFNSQTIDPTKHVHLKLLPLQALDHAAGQLLALGVSAALARTYTEGGSYEVRVSLAGVSSFLRHLPRIPTSQAFGPNATAIPLPGQGSPEVLVLSSTLGFTSDEGDATAAGDTRRKIQALRHAAVLSATPVRVGEAPRGLNAHEAVWLTR